MARSTAKPNTLGHRVRTMRRSLNLTQKELATQCGCSQQTIVDLEAGKVDYSRFTSQIAEQLGVSLHWLETGDGPRDRPGHSQGRVAIVDWEYFMQSALSGAHPQADDWLECCPVANSGDVVMVVADEPTAFIMAGRVLYGDWLFVDRRRQDAGLVIALMPGWNRAELRELTDVGGRHYLKATNPELPDRLIPVSVQNNREAYLDVTQRPSDGIAPALILGRVIMRAQPES